MSVEPAAGGGSGGAAATLAQRTVFVTNVSDRVPETNLRELFELCGKVEDLRRQYDPKTDAMGWAIVFTKLSGASGALMMHGNPLDDRILSVVSEAGAAAPLTPAQQAWKDECDLLASDPSRLALKYMSPQEQLAALMRKATENNPDIKHKDGCDCILCKAKQDEAAGKKKVVVTEPCYLCSSMKHLPIDCPIMKAKMRDYGSGSDRSSSSSSSSSSSYSSRSAGKKRKRRSKDKKDRKRQKKSGKDKKSKKDKKDKRSSKRRR